MANVINKIFTDKMGGRKAAEYIGVKGDLFYDADVGSIRISDGVTPGGKPAAGNGAAVGAVYRNFQAGANMFRNNGNETDITQIIIHNAEGKVDYINYTPDTDNDDFYVTGLQHNDSLTASSWNADKIVVLNIYSQVNSGISSSDLATFVRKFIDTVLYDAEDNQINDLAVVKQAFYDNYEVLAQSLPAGSLFENFEFDDYNRVYWPEYGMIHADGSTESGNLSANFKLRLSGGSVDDPSYDNHASIYFLSSGTGYAIGDKLTVNGGQLGGVNGTNDFTLTVSALKSGNITGLTMTNGGTNFWPDTSMGNFSWLSNGNGSEAAIHINSCDQNGVIQEWEIRRDGYNYQVGDVLTLNYGGDDATFEVTSVGTDGIAEWETFEGNGYFGSPARVEYGYWPTMMIGDGGDDQYDTGNFISTNNSSQAVVADFNNCKMTITNWLNEGAPLQAGQVIYVRNPNDATDYSWTRLVSKSTDNDSVWYVDGSNGWSGAECRIDGINYGGGQVQSDFPAQIAWGGGSYVTVYDNSIFAMIAFGANVNSVYYNGETGVDSGGVKNTEILLGVGGADETSRSIPQNLIWNEEYTLQASDAGKHIYHPNGNNSIYIPVESVVNFPVGTAITFVSTDNPTWISRHNGDLTKVYGAGFDTTSAWWAIPPNSMGTLLKVAPERWIVSGAGLYNDD